MTLKTGKRIFSIQHTGNEKFKQKKNYFSRKENDSKLNLSIMIIEINSTTLRLKSVQETPQ